MKIPEPLFVVINPVVRIVLRSPLHGLLGASLMLITLTGRRSGRVFTVPVRYLREASTVRCLTSRSTRWWWNLVDGAEVRLTLDGAERRYRAIAIADDTARVAEALREMLRAFPQDAPYYELRLGPDGAPDPAQLEAAASRSVLIEAKPVAQA